MLANLWTVLRKEWIDFIRDRRTLKTMLTLVLGMPIFYSVVIGFVENRSQDNRERDLRIGIVRSPALEDFLPFLEQQGVRTIDVSAPEASLYKKDKLDAILSVDRSDPDSEELRIDVWVPGNEMDAFVGGRRVEQLLNAYGQILGQGALILRGIDPDVIHPVKIEMKSLKPDKLDKLVALDLVITILTFGIFFSTLHLAVDMTAGERERLSLESILYTATPKASLVIGKWLFVSGVALVSTTLTGLTFWLLGALPAVQELIGRSSNISLSLLGLAILIFLPLFPLVAGIQLLIGSFCKSVKEAQAYTGILALVTMPLGFPSFFDKADILTKMPILGQALAFRKVLRGESLNLLTLLGVELVTAGLAVLLLTAIIHRFGREDMVRGVS